MIALSTRVMAVEYKRPAAGDQRISTAATLVTHFCRFASIVRTGKTRSTMLTPKTLSFLRSLKRNNKREWFHARKDQFEAA